VPLVLDGVGEDDKESYLKFDDGTDLKTTTVPKLQLCGADLLSRLIAEITGTKVFEGKVYCKWDFADALLNRGAATQDLTESSCHSVPMCFPTKPNESPFMSSWTCISLWLQS